MLPFGRRVASDYAAARRERQPTNATLREPARRQQPEPGGASRDYVTAAAQTRARGCLRRTGSVHEPRHKALFSAALPVGLSIGFALINPMQRLAVSLPPFGRDWLEACVTVSHVAICIPTGVQCLHVLVCAFFEYRRIFISQRYFCALPSMSGSWTNNLPHLSFATEVNVRAW